MEILALLLNIWAGIVPFKFIESMDLQKLKLQLLETRLNVSLTIDYNQWLHVSDNWPVEIISEQFSYTNDHMSTITTPLIQYKIKTLTQLSFDREENLSSFTPHTTIMSARIPQVSKHINPCTLTL